MAFAEKKNTNEAFDKVFRIGDFARKMGVSTHFLKYYEEAGILHPEVRVNGYRYYGLVDASVILQCKALTNLGFSVREVCALVNGGEAKDFEAALPGRENALLGDAARSRLLAGASKNLRDTLSLCEADEWRIGPAPTTWYLPHAEGRGFVEAGALAAQLEQWMQWMPLVRSALLQQPQPGGWLRHWGLSVSAEGAAAAQLPLGAPVYALPEGRVFERYAVIVAGPDSSERMNAACLDTVRRLNLVPDESLIVREVLCYAEKNGERCQYCVTRIRVETEAEAAQRDKL